MPRQIFEFYCSGGCGKYFKVKLNTSLNGNHRIHCPNCGHIHFRQIKNGEITESRFTEHCDDQIIVDDLRPMKASCTDYQTETREENMPATSFLSRLWKERFSHKT